MNGAQMNLMIAQIMPPKDSCQGLPMHLTAGYATETVVMKLNRDTQ